MIKSKLFWKVLGNFGILLVVLTAMTFMTLNVLSQVERTFVISSKETKLLGGVERVRHFLNDTPVAVEDYLFSGDQSSRRAYDDAWKDFDAVISSVQRDATDSVDIQLLSEIRSLFFDWMETVGDKKMLLRKQLETGKDIQSEIVAISRDDHEKKYLITARSILRDIFKRKITSQPQTIDRATSLTNDLGVFIELVNILLAAFAVALGFVLTRSITKPVRLLKEGTQNIMAGRFEPIILHRLDELGELAADFNRMSSLLGSNYTRLNAYSELVTALNTFEEIAEVESKSLELLCHHAGASVGALYLMNGDFTTLDLQAGYALKEEGRQVKSFQVGEGIPGQCALEKRMLEVRDVSVSSGFVVDTGLFTVVPQYVLAVPIFFQERVLGVLVLGSVRPFEEIHKDIINNSLPQIGVALTNARNFEATQKLSREIAGKNDELNQKNSELERAYRVKSDFLASMSHELRTPLNSIIGFTSVLLGPTGDPLTDDQRRALEKVLKNGKHLLQLINDILDFSKLESGRMTVNVDVDEVENVIANSVMTVEAMVKAKDLTLRQNIEPHLPQLKTDTLKVKQILVNLLSNATKFTEKGEVVISVSKKDGMLAFAVKDSGIGIEERNYGKIFEEFQQIDSSNTRKYKGTGLGLPISRRLARVLGGDLVVSSEYGKGSIFTLTIPPVYPEIRAKEEHPPVSRPPSPAPVSPAPTPAATEGFRVLCIDDDPDVIEILRKYLIPEGFSVSEAHSGDEGIKLAAEVRPAVITLDIMMPQKDGWQVLRELKADAKTKDIPVIIHSIIDNKPLAISLGAVDVITKPADPNRLLELVKREAVSKDRHILVVDDNEDFSLAVCRLLEASGFKAEVANNGHQALESLSRSTPSMIFLDLSMPEMDGFEVVQHLQANQLWKNIPVAVLSGKELSKEEWEQLHSHVSDYIKKGDFSPESLGNTIKKILHK